MLILTLMARLALAAPRDTALQPGEVLVRFETSLGVIEIAVDAKRAR